MSSESDNPIWSSLLKGLAAGGKYATRRKDIEESLHQEWYTVPQAAAVLGEHRKTVYERVRRKEIGHSKPSPRKTRIHKSDLVDYLMKQTS